MIVKKGLGGKFVNIASGVEHNPPPRTERGKRRHKNREPGKKKHAESCWGK